MAKKTRSVYVCSNCGDDFPKWQGRCTSCGEWDTISEFREARISRSGASDGHIAAGTVEPVSLSSCEPESVSRISVGMSDLDRVLGGGLVRGSLVLVGGDPGIGKSTLMLQLAAHVALRRLPVLYVSGEESLQQVSLRSRRLGVTDAGISMFPETTLGRVLDVLSKAKPRMAIVDSIQTMMSEELESAPGSVSQVRECAALLMRHAKQTGTAIILVGHVTKDGAIAGPRMLEHMVDTVLYFEGDATHQYRILRAVKNRFGPSGEIALLAMSDTGLAEVPNASDFFLQHRDAPQVGTAVVPVREGSRILVVELQALVNPTHFGLPQRVAAGINPKRLSLLIAVLERYAGISLGDHDVFLNVTGGLAISEPAADFGIAAAMLSSFRNVPLRQGIGLIGEIGLGGEIRPVNSMGARIKELCAMGFVECAVPPGVSRPDRAGQGKMRLLECRTVSDIDDRTLA